jgi:hypothetical protein
MRIAVAQIHSGHNPEVDQAEIDTLFGGAGTRLDDNATPR